MKLEILQKARQNLAHRYLFGLKPWRTLMLIAVVLLSMNQAAFACVRVEKVNIFVASSLIDVVQTLADDFMTKSWCTAIIVVPGSSSITSTQILAGAPADIFISADRYNANKVAENAGALYEPLFGNSLVIVASEKKADEITIAQLPKMLGDGRLAIGDPAHVPAGIYAKQALVAANIFEELEKRLAPAGDARAAASFIKSGAAPYGIVYLTDAKAFELNIVGEIDEYSYSPIGYFGMLLNGENSSAAAFYKYLSDESTLARLEYFGFRPFADD